MATGRHRKVLLYTPSSSSNAERNGDSTAVLAKVQMEQELKMAQSSLKKVLHQQRLKKLRKLVDELPVDDWKYPSFESLIGLK